MDAMTARLQRVDARMLWSTGHYDGPCSGVALHGGRPHWFEVLGGMTSRACRAYALYPLTADEYASENAKQDEFRKIAGWHCDYDENGKRGEAHKNIDRAAYEAMIFRNNDKWKAQRNEYERRQPVGYFLRDFDRTPEQRLRRWKYVRTCRKHGLKP